MKDAHQLDEILKGMKIKAKVIGVEEHPSQIIYDLQLDYTCKVSKIRSSLEEIALALRAPSTPICIAVPAEGKVRLEVSTGTRQEVNFMQHYTAPSKGFLPLFLGKKSNGCTVEMDLSEAPNLIVASATGGGKSVALHTIIGNCMYLKTDLWLSDPKKVEFSPYENKSFVKGFADDLDSTKKMFLDLIEIMNYRYDVLSAANKTNIKEMTSYKLSPIVVIVDEVADLILLDEKKELENLIGRLAQKCRAAGIFIVLSTQRPSVGVISGLIKANFPARLVCKVANRVDSQIVLDTVGAENLLGKGDAILKCEGHQFTRFQLAFNSANENLKY